ncbi:hypothetical protein MAR_034191 [Mya arenaria]|uniref:Uncharacterized protein n=1 Tax=Mya arenaria TaxID=6604 RepID=A0ABY7GDP4_MYAAR|nr:hypothetical protein MAR_034191 [Mya arenaria]
MYIRTMTINGHVFAVKPARHRLPVSSTENGERSKCCISLHVQREDIEVAHTCTFLGLISGQRFKYSTSLPLETNMQCMTCDDLKSPLYNILDTDKDINALRQSHNSSLCCGAVQNIVQLLIKKFYQTITAGSSNILESFIHNCDLEEDLKTPKAKLVGEVDSVPSFIVQVSSVPALANYESYIL